jgi:hypothetical protein
MVRLEWKRSEGTDGGTVEDGYLGSFDPGKAKGMVDALDRILTPTALSHKCGLITQLSL